MLDKSGDYFQEHNTGETIKRYEVMRKIGTTTYFDVDELVDIVGHYIDRLMIPEAYEACQLGLKIHPNDLELRLKSAQLNISMGNITEGQYWLKSVKGVSTHNHEYHLTRGMLELLKNHLQKANGYFNKALELVSAEEYEHLIFTIGEALENSDNFTLAIKFYRRALRQANFNPELLFKLGLCFDKAHHTEQSIDFYQQYLDLNPFSESGWYNLGIGYNKAGQYKKAIEAYEYAYALDNDMYDALFNLGNALANNEQYAEAIEAYTRFNDEFGPSEGALFCIGECLIQLDRPLESFPYFEKIMELNPAFADGWYGNGLALYELDRHDEALYYLDKAIEIDKTHQDAYFVKGSVFAELEQWAQAIQQFEVIVHQNNFDMEAWLNLAHAHAQNTQINKAIEAITQAHELIPTNPDIMYALAGYRFLNHEIALGTEQFLKAYDVFPEFASYIFKTYPLAGQIEAIAHLLININEWANGFFN